MTRIFGRDVSVPALKTIRLELPELECMVILRELDIGQAQTRQTTPDTAQHLALMIVDESGNRLFTTEEDIQKLRGLPLSIGNKLIEAAAKVNGVDLEAAIKNSKASQNGGSGSA